MRMRIAIAALLFTLPAFAEDPWSVDARHPVVTAPRPAPEKPSLPARAMDRAVDAYQRRISAHDGPHCMLYPTCSAYARESFRRHGFLMGLLLTLDRLLQEPDVQSRAPRIRVFGVWRAFDPVEDSDFWWSDRRQRTPKPPSGPQGRGGS